MRQELMAQGTQSERRVVLKRRLRPRPIGEDFLRDRRAFIHWQRQRINQSRCKADEIRISHRGGNQGRNRRFPRALRLLGKA